MQCMSCSCSTPAFSDYRLCFSPTGGALIYRSGYPRGRGRGGGTAGQLCIRTSAYNEASASYIMPHPRVASLHVYPVKGCKGIDVEAAYFERTGTMAQMLPCMHVCTYTRASGDTGAQVWHTIAHGWWSERKRGSSLRRGSTPSLSFRAQAVSWSLLHVSSTDSLSAADWLWSGQTYQKTLWHNPAILLQQGLC